MDIKLSLNPVVLLRIPAFSMNDSLPEVWGLLKLSISHSSSEFYDKIKDVTAEGIADLDIRTQFTIWKYFNRSKYRGTPYGSFAGFAVAKLGDGKEDLVFSKEQHLHRFKDWSQYQEPELSEIELSASDRLYFSNSSHYSSTDHIRYVSLQQQQFELSEIANSSFIQDILIFCAERATYLSILEFASSKAVAEEVLLGMLKAMVDAQLLFTDLHANIVGPDYFERSGMSSHLNHTSEQHTGDYLIAERNVVSGTLSRGTMKHVSSCINSLLSLNLVSVNEDIKYFIKDFQKRFEGQELPLMKVLDPELGIGYGHFVTAAGTDSLAQGLSGHSGQKNTVGLPWLGFTNELVKAMLKGNGDPMRVLQLKDLIPPGADQKGLMPANSFSVLARFAGDLVVLDTIGGCTANALAGRFTLASDEVVQHCKAIAAAESAANPEIIFFDLAYMAEKKIDNINRRKQIYDHELPILNYSCSDQQIGLHDILVTVQGGQVVLFSKKYGKRLVPRLASAYNYGRSDLSVYRFLCDLQHQGIQSQILFDVQALLPGLDHYPRIQYENLVLSPAKWRVKGAKLKSENTLAVLDRLGLSRYFSVGTGDQTLLFDKTNSVDLLFLKQHVNQYDDFVLTEVIESDCQYFTDVDEKRYFTQVLLAVSHQEQLFSGYNSKDFTQNSPVEPVIMPGKDWLSYEIYCHSERSNFLLSARISHFIAAHSEAFKTWFFIRYNDPTPHLRFRLQLRDPERGYYYMGMLMELFSMDLQEGLIKDLQMKTYYREIVRYGAHQMTLTELHFGKDSNYALEVIAHDLDEFSIYANCLRLMKAMLVELPLEKKGILEFIGGVQRSFELEHQLSSDEFKMVNREWVNFKTQFQLADETWSLPLAELQVSFQTTFVATSEEQRPALFCSLFHMHINRLFSDNQRIHELIIYSFLYKQLQMEQQRLVPTKPVF